MTHSQCSDEVFGLRDGHGSKSLLEVDLLLDLGGVTPDASSPESGGAAGTEREQAEFLVQELARLNGREQRGEASVKRGSVHVAKSLGAGHTGVGLLGERGLGSSNEGLLNVLVGERLGVREGEEGLSIRNVGVLGVLGVGDEVVEHHASMPLDGLLAVRAVEDGIIDGIEREGFSGDLGTLSSPCDLLLVGRVSGVECGDIGHDGNGAVNLGVFRGEVGLVEIVGVGHIGSMNG